jgi:DNA integrity scanning protein DisA with diadenylate cyclase activity
MTWRKRSRRCGWRKPCWPGRKINVDSPQEGWRPALEILILAVLIYYAFRFLRGTRGWPVVIGFVVVLLALAW